MEALRQLLRKRIGNISAVYIVRTCCLILSGMGCVLQNLSPFGVACTAALYFSEPGGFSVLLVALGIGLGGFGINTLKYWIALLLLTGTAVNRKWFSTEKRCGIVFLICMFLADVIYSTFTENNVYFWVISSAELVVGFASVKAYTTVLCFLSAKKLRKTMSREELICLSAVLCVCLSGLSGIQAAGIVSVYVLLFCAYSFSYGVCGVLGTLLGFFASLSNPALLYSIGSYSMAALVCCTCKKYGKAGIVMGFVLSNALVTFYVNGSREILIDLLEICIAGGAFLLTPKRKLAQMKRNILLLIQRQEIHKKTEREALEEMAVKRLNRIADAFSVLATSMRKTGKEQKKSEKETAGMLTENVYERVCGACERKNECVFQENTAKNEILNLLQKTVRRGWTEQVDLSADIKQYCLHIEKMLSECNKVYELFRVNRVWENRIAENRELVSKQLGEVSGVMRCLASEISGTVAFEDESEQQIIVLLDGLGMQVENVSVVKGLNNRLAVKAEILNCKNKEACVRDIKAVLHKVTGRNFSVQKESVTKERCVFVCQEKEKYEAQIGISRIRPPKEQVFGDSYAIMYPEDGKMVIALSDGMGTGNRAAKESRETVGLLEHLLMAGIARETAVKLINSVLVLKSYDENFATLDLLVLDLFSGEGELIKNASACSYLCRGNQVGVMAAQALPAGIVGEIEAANRRIVFRSGDWILLVSDGVTDVSIDDKWIKDFLINLGNCTAQQGADRLMEEAVRRVLGCKDDMTVILVKISEK